MFLMENSECFSHTKLPEYKRCRVSAVRDYPLGCGPFAHLSNLNANATDKKYLPQSVEAVREFPPFCGINASPEARKFGQEKSVRDYKSSSSKTVKTNVKQTGLGNKFQPNTEKKIGGKSLKKNHHVPVRAACQGTIQLDIRKEYYQRDEEEHNHVIPKSWSTDGCPPPFGCNSSSRRSHDNDTTERNKVKEILHMFQDECVKLLLEEEHKRSKGGGTSLRRVDLEAFKILKDRGIFVKSGKHVIGDIPGVEVGDKFQYRVELILIGLHHQIQGGIAYGNFGGKVLATSIVASGGYADDLHSKDSLIYTGQGGNAKNTKGPQDQKLERGNLALKNSVQKNPVRVIRGSELLDGSRTYVYDGLYLVEKYWQERGPLGKLVFKFQMNRFGGTGK
ncbi:putative histone-lysine N-methyltransferase [Rosa chinensis]|uniref:Putative histone-lysine N-methyltransferase n=1 Tax=Rosa chinensis TaxID=74649 RepID=A0A2P6P8U5_ROSCH|nr:histone-lysine N-methyltransferase, H3 lysine-9 specific SUVH5 [Rosa chinensis]XP_040367001.1 histone-lysine N-methyltransferase, H3 lysine-9 specific SUVH5 [Rosa chinensis]XP_040367002.1 histone-lysine N-methyltransferase, H3 lysine-9 specific SUVH5 [Rosa chinensis]PRQ18353.1 putative histone-lysine N-methyltransferase [Rosa chinensis]